MFNISEVAAKTQAFALAFAFVHKIMNNVFIVSEHKRSDFHYIIIL